MSIIFDVCCFCRNGSMRTKPYLMYNQSQDIFYYVWQCIDCLNVIYVDAKPSEVDNNEQKKKVCLWSQKWNEKAVEYNNKLFKKAKEVF